MNNPPRGGRPSLLPWGVLAPLLMAPASLFAQDPNPVDSVSTFLGIPDSAIEAFPIDRPFDLLAFHPGITATNNGELLLRGGKPGDAAVYVDGIPVLSAFRSTPFFGLSRFRTLESRIGVPPRAVRSLTAVTGPLPAEWGNGQSGAIFLRTRAGDGPLKGGLSYETDEPFGSGASLGLNRVEANLSGTLGRLSLIAAGLLEGQRSIGSGVDADAAPLFVQTRLDTTVAVPSAFGDPFADTALVDVHSYAVSRGNCEDFRASANPEIADNYGLACRGSQTPFSPVSTYQLLGKLSYGAGRSAVSLLAIAGQSQNRNFEYGTLYNPVGVTGNRTSSSLIALSLTQPLNRSPERPLLLDASLSLQSDRERSGPLTLEEEQNTTDPFAGFLIRPLDLRFDFDNFPVDEELVRNYRTNLVGSRRSPYDLENPAQYALIDRYRNNAYALYGRSPTTNIIFPESGGPVGLLTLYREQRLVATAALGWQLNRSNSTRVGGELTRYSMDNYSHFLESQAFSDVYREDPVRFAFFVQHRLQAGAGAVSGGLRYESFDTRARRPAEFPRLWSHPQYDPSDPEAFFSDNSLFPRDESHSRIAPHIDARYAISPRTRFRGSFAQQLQVPDLRLALVSVNTDIAMTSIDQVFGQDLDFERTNVFELGIQQDLGPGTTLDLAIYSKTFESEVIARREPRLDPSTGVDRELLVLENAGSGSVRGVDLRLERSWGGMFAGWLGYSYQKAERDIEAGFLIQEETVPAENSRPHSVTGALALTIPDDWKQGSAVGGILRNVGLSALLRVTSGTPYTRCQPGFFADISVLSPDLCSTIAPGSLNDSRLPAYKQLDLRLIKRFGTGGRFAGYLDARNVLNFRNVLAVFAATGETDNPAESSANWSADSADLSNEAIQNGRYRSDGSIDLGEGLPDPRIGCGLWADQAGNPAAPNCIYLIRAEERFGDSDHVFDLTEQQRASDALYHAVRGPQELTGPPRLIRVGLEANF